jgi:sugar phosphate isomerase/epimerase
LGPEIDVTRHVAFGAGLEDTLGLLGQYGIELPCFGTSVTLISPGPQRWQDMLDEARRYAVLAGRTGTAYLRVFGGAPAAGMTREEARAMAERHLRQVIKICRTHGTMPLVETHATWATAGQLKELLHEFDPGEVGVLWDVEHPCRSGEAPGETAEALRRFVRHVHMKDSSWSDGKSTPRLLGEGDLPLGDFVRALRGMGYEGWVCLETEKRWHPEVAPDPDESIPHFASYMRAIEV